MVKKKHLFWLKTEAEKWKEAGIINSAQYAAIMDRYDLNTLEKQKAATKIITALSIVGALLLGAGIILLLASNWASIPKFLRLSLIILVFVGINYLGYHWQYLKGNYPRLGSSILFLGAILFGAVFWLIAQMYHIESSQHNGVLVWALFILPMAWILRSHPILVLSTSLITLWVIVRSIDFFQPNFIFIPIFAIGIIPFVYLYKNKLSLLFIIVGLSLCFFSGLIIVYFENYPFSIISFILFFPVLLYTLGLFHSYYESLSEYKLIYEFTGIVILCAFMFAFSFYEMADDILYEIMNYYTTKNFILIFIGFGVILLSLIIIPVLKDFKNKTKTKRFLTNLLFILVFFVLTILFGLIKDPLFFMITANIVLLLLAIWMIIKGYYDQIKLYINAGFILFAIHFFVRYIDYGYEYADRAIFYIIAGLIFLLLAFGLERGRRKLLSNMDISSS